MKRLIIGAAILALAACAVNKTLVPVGGSRSDGTVKLAYEFGLFEKPRVDGAAALQAATARCQAWGYTSAEPFGGAVTQCQQTNGYGNCLRTLVTIEYQCGGAGKPN
jgi:hypothetical protein